ncbi:MULTISPECIES: YhbD family protein [unclassified Clostridium]|uniref:YhbD family protein n=1 Tax=unclassified Clostridium TaxID=2614128 RepID=UPI0025C68E03|nr:MULTISPECIES: YhbD family protein [unclassified Clostridium]
MEDLISKKELLEVTNISYGQLYRWKRKKLIPEEWFIKKSSFTGQETYFPKEKILDRIEKILSFKEDMQLDDLAEMFSPKVQIDKKSKEELLKLKIIDNSTLEIYRKIYGEKEIYDFHHILSMYILDNILPKGEIILDEAKSIIAIINNNYMEFQNNNYKIFLMRKLGVSFCIATVENDNVILDETVKVVLKLELSNYIEELKLKLV